MTAPAGRPAWVLDLDGVVWRGRTPVPGSPEAVGRLRSAGHDVWFVTNNAWATIDQTVDKLRSVGIDPDPDRVVTSARAAASLLGPDDEVVVLGGPGIHEAVERAGARLARDPASASALVVGLDRNLDYERLTAAVVAALAGARFVATNTDVTYPTEQGLWPGAGALVAAVSTSARRDPDVVAGKPHEAAAALVRPHLPAGSIMVGDRPETDGLFARRLGCRFGLVLSGATSPDELPVEPQPDATAPDLAALVAENLQP